MSDNNDLKQQRDRFLAFSFASADLLLEIDANNAITSALGATRNLIGVDERTAKGMQWHELFSLKDQAHLKESLANMIAGQRIGPVFVTLAHKHNKVLFSSIKMPASDHLYITLGLAHDLSDLIYSPHALSSHVKQLPQREDLFNIFEDKLRDLQTIDQSARISLLDLGNFRDLKERIGQDAWSALSSSIAESISSYSLGQDAAGQLSESKYTFIHDHEVDIEAITSELNALALTNDPSGEGLNVRNKTLDADTSALSQKDLSRSLMYTLNSFEAQGVNADVDSITEGFDHYLEHNTDKLEELKSFIKDGRFDLYFQPIIEMSTGELSHYEILSRFTHGNTQEWVIFAEDVGLAADLDLTVIDKALNYIKYKAGNTHTKFSVNISGQSIGDEDFFSRLLSLLQKYPDIERRLSFEVTESYHIDNLHQVRAHLDTLREASFKVALDDFGAGSASLQYLQELNIDVVKIDGKYIRNLRESQRDVAIVKNIANMCHDLGIAVIAEYVEDNEIVKMLQKFGILYAQGFHYSRPRPAPDYINKT